MPQMRRGFILLAAVASLFGILAYGQDSQPLGDVARQARQQKQNKTGQASKTPKVITNEEIPESPEAAQTSDSNGQDKGTVDSSSSSGGAKQPAETWKSKILAQKEALRTLQSNIDKLNDSIQFAPANCVSGCVQWNERQKQKQREVAQMRSQLETQKKRLQDMQESARQQGYGSSVYDP